jgi:hypothetical protein
MKSLRFLFCCLDISCPGAGCGKSRAGHSNGRYLSVNACTAVFHPIENCSFGVEMCTFHH